MTIAAGTSLSHRQVLVILGALLLGMFLAALDQTIVAVALPTIVGELGGLNHISYVVTAYLLTSTVGTPLFGKVSDLYGRKRLFEVAIAIFLAGSVLCGLSQNLVELILFRAVQGFGAGGMIALTQTILGDIVSPRERGRYQGYIGSVFALASVGGPLLGGFFVDQLSWRFVFYINVPLGLVALLISDRRLDFPFQTRRAVVDYLGAALLVSGVSALLLVSVWGGSEYGWSSPIIVGLIIAAAVLLALFVLQERHVEEPIIPPRLFADGVFRVCGADSFLIGMAMLGTITFLPLFLQLVTGANPTESGLMTIPLVGSIVVASVGSGQIITRVGRYKPFPVAGTALVALGLFLFSTMGPNVSLATLSLYQVVIGLGLGMTMQVLVLAVQNSVSTSQLGAATSSVTFLRSLGGSLGTALFGLVLSSRLAQELPRATQGLPGASSLDPQSLRQSPEALAQLPGSLQDAVVQAFANALDGVFLTGAPVAALAFLIVLFLRERPLRTTPAVAEPSQSEPEPSRPERAVARGDRRRDGTQRPGKEDP